MESIIHIIHNDTEVKTLELFLELFGNVLNFTWQQALMIVIGGAQSRSVCCRVAVYGAPRP